MRTKTSSDPVPPRLPDRERAWFCVAINLLALPGLGSYLAGQRLLGATQMVLALAGFALTMVWAVSFGAAWIRGGHFPGAAGPGLRHGVLGLSLFAIAWCWTLGSSWSILRRARTMAR